MSVNVAYKQDGHQEIAMAVAYEKRPFVGVIKILEAIDKELATGASTTQAITLLHIFDVCGASGVTAKDIQMLTGQRPETISRMLKIFNEQLDVIDYQSFGSGPKIILLTPKGEALKQRVFSAQNDFHATAQLQQSIVDENMRTSREIEKALARKDVKVELSGQNLEMKAEVGEPIVASGFDLQKMEQAHREAVADAITYETGEQLKAKIWGLKAGTNRYVFDQIIRARRKAVQNGANGFDWRHCMIEIYDPKYGYEQRDELHRELVHGVWFYYNKDEAPEQHLPVAVQRDFTANEFEAFIEALIEDLTDHFIVDSDVGDVTFSSLMKDTREMLNTTQYNKARDRATRAVATVATTWEEAIADSKAKVATTEEHLAEAEHKAKALHSFANSPTIPVGERTQFRYDAYGADREAAEARAKRDDLEKALDDQRKQIEQLTKMMAQLMEDKNAKE